MEKFEEFNHSLIQSIDEYMDLYEKNYPNVWCVNKVNLRYVIERELYFSYMSKLEYFYELYIQNKSDEGKKKMQSALSRLIINKPITLENIEPCTVQEIDYLIKGHVKEERLLIFVDGMRLYKYVEKIIEKLRIDIHILLWFKDEELEKYLSLKKIPFSVYSLKHGNEIYASHLQGLSSTNNLTSAIKTLNNLKVSKILTIEGSKPLDQLFCELGNRLGLDTFCIQHGYAPDYASSFKNMSYDKFFTWGDYFSDGFNKYNEHTNFLSVGNHTLEESNGFQSQVKSIGFFLQTNGFFITQDDMEYFLDLIIQTAKQYPNIQVYTREHPRFAQEERVTKLFIDNNILIANQNTHNTSGEVLKMCDVAVSFASSSLVEAIATDTVPLFLNTFNLKIFDNFIDKSGALMAYTFQEAANIIDKLVEDDAFFIETKEKISLTKPYICSSVAGESLLQIVNEIQG